MRRHPNSAALEIIASGLSDAHRMKSWDLVAHYLEALENLRHGRPAFGERTASDDRAARQDYRST
jgi:hypothetical protein